MPNSDEVTSKGQQIAKITVTKLSAARGQLHAAIHLWFEGGDPVAIHTLASAAHEIIHALFRNKGLKGLAFDTSKVKPELRQRWASDIKQPANFFKHGRNEDSDAQIEFDPVFTEMLMTACVKGLKDIGAPIGMEELAFTYWLFSENPAAFPHIVEGARKNPKIQFIQELAAKGREVYFREFAAAFGKTLVFPDGRSGENSPI